MLHDITAELTTTLDGPDVVRFLAVLVDELTLAARNEYTVGGNDAMRAGAGLRALNEIARAAAAQLGKAIGTGASGYPSEVFLNVVTESAVAGHVDSSVDNAFRRTLDRLRRLRNP